MASLIPVAEPVLGEEEIANVVEALRSGWISSLGAFIGEFERAFAAYCGARNGIAVCNGTAALHLALAAAGVGPGDEVLVPTLTFVATANVVRYCGATPGKRSSPGAASTGSQTPIARRCWPSCGRCNSV